MRKETDHTERYIHGKSRLAVAIEVLIALRYEQTTGVDLSLNPPGTDGIRPDGDTTVVDQANVVTEHEEYRDTTLNSAAQATQLTLF